MISIPESHRNGGNDEHNDLYQLPTNLHPAPGITPESFELSGLMLAADEVARTSNP